MTKKTEAPATLSLGQQLAAKSAQRLAERRPIRIPGLPEFDGQFFACRRPSSERSDLEDSLTAGDDELGQRYSRTSRFRAELLRRYIVGPNDVRPFAEMDVDEILAFDGATLEPLVDAALAMSGLSKTDQDQLEKK